MKGINAELLKEEKIRYARHILLPEVGMEGQEKLKGARVLIIGMGGLGSPSAMYLAAAGVGTLGLVDADIVDVSNLQRQIIHSSKNVGMSKVDSAKSKIHEMNPLVKVETYREMIDLDNASRLIKSYDLVIDGSDNFPTRYLVSDTCVLLNKPYVYGSVFRFEGQVSFFRAELGPCYRCLFPEPPPPDSVPDCSEAGVFGILPGITGLIQASEAIKFFLGMEESLSGRLLLFDVRSMRFQEFLLKKNTNCRMCGKNGSKIPIQEKKISCCSSSKDNITPQELYDALDGTEPPLLVDIREAWEHELNRIEPSILIPINTFKDRSSELDSSRQIVVYCQSGARSKKAVKLLNKLGFKDVKNLEGGIEAYQSQRVRH